MKYTEGEIVKKLHEYYRTTDKYVISNSYLFSHDWESDFFTIKKGTGYCYEYEIKISRADFKNDMKKVKKHSILSTGEYTDKLGRTHTHARRPNRFYYVVPENLIKVEEVPSYAGLIYITQYGGIDEIKKAPLIHKNYMEFDKELCQKYYFHASNLRYENWRLSEENRRLLEKYKHFDYDTVAKMSKATLRTTIHSMYYKEYFKFMLDFFDLHEIREKLIELGFCVKLDGVEEIEETENKGRWKIYNYVELSKSHRPLNENEFKKLIK